MENFNIYRWWMKYRAVLKGIGFALGFWNTGILLIAWLIASDHPDWVVMLAFNAYKEAMLEGVLMPLELVFFALLFYWEWKHAKVGDEYQEVDIP